MAADELSRVLHDEYLASLEAHLMDPKRLAATYSAAFLASSLTDQLDALVASAKVLLAAPHGGITLQDDKHVMLVTHDPDVVSDMTPASESFCRHVQAGRPFAVTNSINDLVVCHLDAVTEHGIMAYLGVPILHLGQIVGALCVWDDVERKWTNTQVRLLTGLSFTVQELLSPPAAVFMT